MKTLWFWLVMVGILSILPVSGPMNDTRRFSELAFHFLVYGITALLIMHVLVNDSGDIIKAIIKRLGGKKSAWISAALATAIALMVECVRIAFPRSGGFVAEDVAASALGAAAWATYAIWVSARKKKRRKPQ